MRILVISTNSLPASPSGAAYIAGAAKREGHQVEVFESLFASDVAGELTAHIARFDPQVAAISIRLVHGYLIDETAPFHTVHVDLRPRVKEVVETVRRASTARIVLGGPGFNYYAESWLEYLDLDYGIRGEADFSFPQYLRAVERGEDHPRVPGSIFRRNGEFEKTPRDRPERLDETAMPAYELFDLERYQQNHISPAIVTKRGCGYKCSYCPYASLEGARYRLKSPGRVVDEVEHVMRMKKPEMFTFCDNNFNVPREHASRICAEIIRRGLDIRWGTGDLRPVGLTDDFIHLLRDSGCAYVNLSIESGSDQMLQGMKRGYTRRQVKESLQVLEGSGIPYGASLMFGAPGETPETIAESLDLLEGYSIPLGTWVTVGICLWSRRQEVLAEAYRSGQIRSDAELFTGANYVSPGLPESYMRGLITWLSAKPGYTVQVNKPFANAVRAS